MHKMREHGEHVHKMVTCIHMESMCTRWSVREHGEHVHKIVTCVNMESMCARWSHAYTWRACAQDGHVCVHGDCAQDGHMRTHGDCAQDDHMRTHGDLGHVHKMVHAHLSHKLWCMEKPPKLEHSLGFA